MAAAARQLAQAATRRERSSIAVMALAERRDRERCSDKTRRVHFVGIGGIGMSGIAELLANLGYAVSGSDDAAHRTITDRLAIARRARRAGARRARTSATRTSWCISSAVRPTNPEVVEAARRQIPVIPRAEMLAELMRLRFAIAVAGAHGKTTTTSMIALVLERAGLDPTAVIGGRLSAFGSNARLGRGELMVAEADESDRSFLKLSPTIAVITNIDHEHLESYGGFDDLQQAFVDFANKVPFYGAVVACADDPHLAAVLPRDDAARDHLRPRRRRRRRHRDRRRARAAGGPRRSSAARAHRRPTRSRASALGPLKLQRARPPQPAERAGGRRRRARARPAVRAHRRGARGVPRRRAALRACAARPSGVLVVDDYGHHPTEIAAVLAAARDARAGRIVVAFQPHRFTRTAALMDAFGPALAGADRRRADRHLRRRRGSDSRGHARGARRRGPRAASSGRCDRRAAARRRRAGAWCGSRRPGDAGDHARRRLDRHGAGSARRGAERDSEGAA